jgi:hypothetical protein
MTLEEMISNKCNQKKMKEFTILLMKIKLQYSLLPLVMTQREPELYMTIKQVCEGGYVAYYNDYNVIVRGR